EKLRAASDSSEAALRVFLACCSLLCTYSSIGFAVTDPRSLFFPFCLRISWRNLRLCGSIRQASCASKTPEFGAIGKERSDTPQVVRIHVNEQRLSYYSAVRNIGDRWGVEE